jgi:hypothetical protein
MTGRIKKANQQRELDALTFNVLASFRHQGALQWTDWYETTKAKRGKLSTSTFSEAVKRLTAEGWVQADADGAYQAIFDAENSHDAGNSAAVETNPFDEVISEALRKAGNGNADITDIALQQLTDREFQAS